MAKRYRAGELYNGGGNPAVYLASDYAALAADRDQISLTLDVAKADRDKWFNRAKVLEAALAKANALGHQNVKPDFALKTPEPAKGKPMFNYNGDLVGYEPETEVESDCSCEGIDSDTGLHTSTCISRMCEYHFDRFRNGRQMAQGAIVNAFSPTEAFAKAKALYRECPNDTFVLRDTSDRGVAK